MAATKEKHNNNDPYVKLVTKYTPERNHDNWIRYSYALANTLLLDDLSPSEFLRRFDIELSKSTKIRNNTNNIYYCITNPYIVLEVYYR